MDENKVNKTSRELIYQDEDDFFYRSKVPASHFIALSHMNNKSSVLCPETQDVTSQYLILQQLDAHQRMISRAKGCVDASAPKSLQSYRSIINQKKKKLWQHLQSESRSLAMTDLENEHVLPCSSKEDNFSEKDENESLAAASMNKAIQTGIPFVTFSSKVADKISWYLEALSQGMLQSQPYIVADSASDFSRSSGTGNGINNRKRIVKGDIMEWHKKHFVQPKKLFSPRILAEKSSKSKVKEMRCYNPPFRKRRNGSSHSSDTFESYDEEEENEDEISSKNGMERVRNSDAASAEIETQINMNFPRSENYNFSSQMNSLLHHPSGKYSVYKNHSHIVNKNDEDKYLEFLSKVTEDILRSGVYSDRAIQRAFEFHKPFYEDDTNKEKLQSLLQQILEGLKISSDESEEILNQNTSFFPVSRPDTPPEKEISDNILVNSHIFKGKLDLNSLTKNEISLDVHSKTSISTDVTNDEAAVDDLEQSRLSDS